MISLQRMSLMGTARIGVGMVVMVALTAIAAQAQTATACRHKGALWVKNTSGKTVQVTVQNGWENPSRSYPLGHEAVMEGVKKDLAVTLRAPEAETGGVAPQRGDVLH